jgi:hypothetical protein
MKLNETDERDVLAAIRYANDNLPTDARGITATELAEHVEWAKGPEPRIRRALDRLSTRGAIECNNGRFWKIR